jgi:hypothetical protein
MTKPKKIIQRLLGKLMIIGFCTRHDMVHDISCGYYGERGGCSKCCKATWSQIRKKILKDLNER